MAGRHLPRPVTESGEFLAAIHDQLGEQSELLSRILDRLPEPAPAAEKGDTVELREPAPREVTGEQVEEPAAAPVKRTRKPRAASK